MSSPSSRLHLLAWAVAAATLLMIVAGGLVTTLKAGDSVPDWPLSYGKVYPSEHMIGGVVFEHGHRMVGWAVGALTLALVVGLYLGPPQGRLRTLGIVCLLAVLVQGGLGGLRVLVVSNESVRTSVREFLDAGHDLNPVRIGIAIVHAGLAQTVFCLFVAVAILTSPSWRGEGRPTPHPRAGKVRRLGAMTAVFVFVQLVLGSLARHTAYTGWIHIHLLWAFVVVGHVFALVGRALSVAPETPAIRRPALFLGGLAGVQLCFGVGAWVARLQSEGSIWTTLVRTSHVAIGAMILATTVALTLAAHRWLEPAAEAAA